MVGSPLYGGPGGHAEVTLTLFFAPDFAGTGSADPQFLSGDLYIHDQAYYGIYHITGATSSPLADASTVPEPGTGLIVALALLVGVIFATLAVSCLLITYGSLRRPWVVPEEDDDRRPRTEPPASSRSLPSRRVRPR